MRPEKQKTSLLRGEKTSVRNRGENVTKYLITGAPLNEKDFGREALGSGKGRRVHRDCSARGRKKVRSHVLEGGSRKRNLESSLGGEESANPGGREGGGGILCESAAKLRKPIEREELRTRTKVRNAQNALLKPERKKQSGRGLKTGGRVEAVKEGWVVPPGLYERENKARGDLRGGQRAEKHPIICEEGEKDGDRRR